MIILIYLKAIAAALCMAAPFIFLACAYWRDVPNLVLTLCVITVLLTIAITFVLQRDYNTWLKRMKCKSPSAVDASIFLEPSSESPAVYALLKTDKGDQWYSLNSRAGLDRYPAIHSACLYLDDQPESPHLLIIRGREFVAISCGQPKCLELEVQRLKLRGDL